MNLTDSHKTITTRLLFGIGILIYFITAHNSHGFYHTDEHYQLLEFARVKLEPQPPTDLSWEYAARIRTAFQPTIAYLVVSTCKALGVDNVYNQVFALRLITALLAIIAIGTFIKTIIKRGNISSNLAYLSLSLFIGFIPFFNVRFSSETWSGLLFLLATTFILKQKKSFFIVGLLMGFSFLCRYQAGIFIGGSVAWLLYYKKVSNAELSHLFSGISLVVLLGFLIDSWYYGEWVLTTWNYLSAAFGASEAPDFGSKPWHFFFSELTVVLGYPMATLLILGSVLFFIVQRNHLVTWIVLSFLFIHLLIPYKELRFLVPIINFLPFMLVVVIDQLVTSKRYFQIPIVKYSLKVVFTVFILINMVLASNLAVKATGNGMAGMSRFISNNYTEKPINLIYCTWSNPFKPWGNTIGFYRNDRIKHQEISSICKLNDGLLKADHTNLIIMRRADIIQHEECAIKLEKAILIKESYPWLTNVLAKQFELYDLKEELLLYEI